jgi:hypothetical protein
LVAVLIDEAMHLKSLLTDRMEAGKKTVLAAALSLQETVTTYFNGIVPNHVERMKEIITEEISTYNGILDRKGIKNIVFNLEKLLGSSLRSLHGKLAQVVEACGGNSTNCYRKGGIIFLGAMNHYSAQVEILLVLLEDVGETYDKVMEGSLKEVDNATLPVHLMNGTGQEVKTKLNAFHSFTQHLNDSLTDFATCFETLGKRDLPSGKRENPPDGYYDMMYNLSSSCSAMVESIIDQLEYDMMNLYNEFDLTVDRPVATLIVENDDLTSDLVNLRVYAGSLQNGMKSLVGVGKEPHNVIPSTRRLLGKADSLTPHINNWQHSSKLDLYQEYGSGKAAQMTTIAKQEMDNAMGNVQLILENLKNVETYSSKLVALLNISVSCRNERDLSWYNAPNLTATEELMPSHYAAMETLASEIKANAFISKYEDFVNSLKQFHSSLRITKAFYKYVRLDSYC